MLSEIISELVVHTTAWCGKPFDVQLVAASDDADVAVLRGSVAPSEVRQLVRINSCSTR